MFCNWCEEGLPRSGDDCSSSTPNPAPIPSTNLMEGRTIQEQVADLNARYDQLQAHIQLQQELQAHHFEWKLQQFQVQNSLLLHSQREELDAKNKAMMSSLREDVRVKLQQF